MAKTYEVKMLNSSQSGTMVFEPDYLQIELGDKVIFKATQPSHNAATIAQMIPEGAKPFTSTINEEAEITFDIAGFYGIECVPHYAMGMVMMIKVGNVKIPDSYLDLKQPSLACKRFDAIFSRIAKDQ